MKTAVVVLALVAAVAGQRYVDPKQAAILQEARYLSGDGSFGSAYNQEDGTQFKEETDAEGNRKGQYSYVGDDGKTITVAYTAGKNGFQVTGDHLPKAPAPPPHSAQQQQQAYRPQQQYNPAPQQQRSYSGNNNEDGQYNPEVHERPYAYNDQYHTTTNFNSRPAAPAPQQQNQGFQNYHNSLPSQQAPVNYQTTTPPPSRFFPPGKLNLNRTPDGYQYTFQS
ncbi:Pupal cuticle protein 27 [Orchesella cincta]|uniref:Pupal cuticle protein 27 n=1 Tax=Orchesella cincta TaxID=48709 RepID=A0A1D2MWB5_ORCCI|nr:Pupal cuticle protein 27 [Orchesella cincta]